ncbi:uncharacterized protein MONOS_5077 [Monocercomonoides exilis]|uniref:uncharacterized protein n=1 Tax=Monocercomonoides exilis TaxID=2049356 RepID=UPI00355A64EE|nr:hypothetical protein MONOS_5077 [Monocercomonoides exilis]|eukprot:MONOS_5077.1-p1 / transcript=MONOS_5077.1 / gene=MONOS_5077 / organism=Monocercomonoides_exilis_PA203 / gene_product=unspecified product / transcript_product=unspecified product / location=Mono_scaffold00144:32240-32809(+) / protein_length=190 / sequence_SO=supercontig / SO=protein_coding / is_pseudo=false
MEDAKKADFRSKLSSEQRKGRQQEEPKAKTKKKEKGEFCTSQIDAFDTRQVQAATERRRRDRGREEGGDENDDEQQQTFYSFDNTLSSARLHTQKITASSTISLFTFSRLHNTQLSSSSVLVDCSPKPLALFSLYQLLFTQTKIHLHIQPNFCIFIKHVFFLSFFLTFFYNFFLLASTACDCVDPSCDS